MTMKLPIVLHPAYDAQFSPEHRFPMGKYGRLANLLAERGLAGPHNTHHPEPATRELLIGAHDAAYVDHVIARSVPQAIEKEIGFAVDERVSLRARLASAGTLLAARLALDTGLACNAAGGSHHARREQGAGFCTFNDVAVAAAALLADRTIAKALVIDLDVHQGDGTARIFEDDARVFTFSMHGEKNYPTRKATSDMDVGLPDGLEDAGYLSRLSDWLPWLFDQVRPDLVFYNAGVDPHADDRLGRLALSDDGLSRRDHMVITAALKRGVPLCGVIGGGYSRDVAALAARHAILFETAAAILDARSLAPAAGRRLSKALAADQRTERHRGQRYPRDDRQDERRTQPRRSPAAPGGKRSNDDHHPIGDEGDDRLVQVPCVDGVANAKQDQQDDQPGSTVHPCVLPNEKPEGRSHAGKKDKPDIGNDRADDRTDWPGLVDGNALGGAERTRQKDVNIGRDGQEHGPCRADQPPDPAKSGKPLQHLAARSSKPLSAL
jgi:acetoin utilization deacetylase AcuC-like enzyme